MNPTLGGLVDSTSLTNGIHHLVLEFVPSSLSPVTSSETITLRIDNNMCIGTLGSQRCTATEPTLIAVC